MPGLKDQGHDNTAPEESPGLHDGDRVLLEDGFSDQVVNGDSDGRADTGGKSQGRDSEFSGSSVTDNGENAQEGKTDRDQL